MIFVCTRPVHVDAYWNIHNSFFLKRPSKGCPDWQSARSPEQQQLKSSNWKHSPPIFLQLCPTSSHPVFEVDDDTQLPAIVNDIVNISITSMK